MSLEGDSKIVVLGSTFAGLGAAMANGNHLVVDRSSQVGYEFINSFNCGDGWPNMSLSAESSNLQQELVERGILVGRQIILPAMAPVLYARIQHYGLRVLLQTEIVKIENSAVGFDITIHNISGLQKLKAERIIDTRWDGSYPCLVTEKYLNAIIHHSNEAEPIPFLQDEQIQLTQGFYPGDAILKIKLDQDDNWPVARQKLYSFWNERPKILHSWKLVVVADNFEVQTKQKPWIPVPGWLRLPSVSFNSPLESFENGIVAGGGNWT